MPAPILLQTSNTELTDGQRSADPPLRGTGRALHLRFPEVPVCTLNHVFTFKPPEPQGVPHERLLNQILTGELPVTRAVPMLGIPISWLSTKKHREGDWPGATVGKHCTFSVLTSLMRQTGGTCPPICPLPQHGLPTASPAAITVRQSHAVVKSLDAGIRETWVQILVQPFIAV